VMGKVDVLLAKIAVAPIAASALRVTPALMVESSNTASMIKSHAARVGIFGGGF